MTAPIDVLCVQCGAKPGWYCVGAPNSGRSGRRVPSHPIRIEDSKNAEVVGHQAGAARYDHASVADGTDIPSVPSAALSPTDLWMEHAGLGYER